MPEKWWNLVDLARSGEPVTDRQEMWWAGLDEAEREQCEELLGGLRDTLGEAEENDDEDEEVQEEAEEPATSTTRRRNVGPPDSDGSRLTDVYRASKKLRF